MNKLIALIVPIMAAASLTACAGSYSGKDVYSFYLGSQTTSNGTLDRSGRLDVTYNGEHFVGQNANNKIEAKGDKGTTLSCSYTMPGDEGAGTCKSSNGTNLSMKFN